MKFTVIHPKLLPDLWPHVSPLLNKAVRLNPEIIDLGNVYAGALAGVYVVWAAVDETTGEFVGAITTRIITYPKSKALALDFVGGTRIKEWVHLGQEAVEEHAKRNGCTHLEGYGRRAWLKYIEPLGWNQAFITYKKEL